MSKPVVAIVDDDPRVLASLEELLESAGYATISFVSAEALLAHGLTGVEILITDIGMPGADGFELRDRVWRTFPELPVFLITGRHEITDPRHSFGRGGFLRKPFDGHALLAASARLWATGKPDFFGLTGRSSSWSIAVIRCRICAPPDHHPLENEIRLTVAATPFAAGYPC